MMAGMSLEKVRHLIEYIAVRTFSAAIRLVPRRVAVGAGRSLGALLFSIDGGHRRVALSNLSAAYPDEPEEWRQATARAAFQHLGRLLVEILLQGRRADEALSLARIEGWDWVKQVKAQGKGYFLLSGHFGNWEMIAHLQGALGEPLWMVARPLDNPLLERYFAGLRESTGNRVVHKRSALRETVKGLKERRGIAFVIDQNFGEPGRVFVPFFGRMAATTPALGSIASRLDAPVLPVFAYPEKDGSYRIVYGPPLDIPSTGDREADALEITRRATERIEAAIRQRPGAWFWMHRRWRTRPVDEMDREVR